MRDYLNMMVFSNCLLIESLVLISDAMPITISSCIVKWDNGYTYGFRNF